MLVKDIRKLHGLKFLVKEEEGGIYSGSEAQTLQNGSWFHTGLKLFSVQSSFCMKQILLYTMQHWIVGGKHDPHIGGGPCIFLKTTLVTDHMVSH